jgi:hypothetical protein
MDALHQAENYLVARGCDIHKIKDHLIEFRLPGETSRTPGGRLSLARDGTLTMWHRYAEKGLAAGLPWLAAVQHPAWRQIDPGAQDACRPADRAPRADATGQSAQIFVCTRATAFV